MNGVPWTFKDGDPVCVIVQAHGRRHQYRCNGTIVLARDANSPKRPCPDLIQHIRIDGIVRWPLWWIYRIAAVIPGHATVHSPVSC